MSRFVTLEEFGKAFIPKRIRPRLRKYLFKAGYTEVPYTLYGGLFVLSVIVSAAVYIFLLFPKMEGLNAFLFMILTFVFWAVIQSAVLIFIIVVLYIWLDTKIFQRTKDMENVLEEFLRYVSENLKGGMPFDRALWEAIRPQYGILSEEISLVAKRVMTGLDISDALIDFTEKYDSPLLRRSFQLIIEGMKGGGNIAYLIDRVEANIRETKELREEMIAANTTYSIFMTTIVLAIAPVLFGLSYNLLVILQSIGGKLAGAGTAARIGGIDFSKISINPDAFVNFSIGALAVIGLFSSMILSLIRHGNIKQGLKYIPIFILVSITMYFIFKEGMYLIFSNLLY
jgi:pilus assembly protein TadC